MSIHSAVGITYETGIRKLSLASRNYWLMGLLAFLLLAAYARMLIWTGQVILSNEDMAHAAFAPIVALYIAIQKRNEVLACDHSPSAWGLLVLLAAGVLSLVGVLGDSSTLTRFAFLFSLAGCILAVGGFRALSTLKFPLLLLLFTFPIPPVIYAEITAPLQSLATGLSQGLLEILGFSSFRDGNILEFPHYRLSVVEACSGIRSLIALLFFCVLYAYFIQRSLLARLATVALSIPCALLLNVVRITVTGVFGELHPAFTRGIYHEALGWLCLGLGFGLVLILHQTLRFARRRLNFGH